MKDAKSIKAHATHSGWNILRKHDIQIGRIVRCMEVALRRQAGDQDAWVAPGTGFQHADGSAATREEVTARWASNQK